MYIYICIYREVFLNKKNFLASIPKVIIFCQYANFWYNKTLNSEQNYVWKSKKCTECTLILLPYNHIMPILEVKLLHIHTLLYCAIYIHKVSLKFKNLKVS